MYRRLLEIQARLLTLICFSGQRPNQEGGVEWKCARPIPFACLDHPGKVAEVDVRRVALDAQHLVQPTRPLRRWLFPPQRHQRIQPGGARRRNIACRKRDEA